MKVTFTSTTIDRVSHEGNRYRCNEPLEDVPNEVIEMVKKDFADDITVNEGEKPSSTASSGTSSNPTTPTAGTTGPEA